MDEKKWHNTIVGDHPLVQLEGKSLSDARLGVLFGPNNRYGARYFKLILKGEKDRLSQSILLGLYNSGKYPGYNWIEIISLSRHTQLDGQDIFISDINLQKLLQYLSNLIPPGGHMMVEYESDEWEDTRLSLLCGIPPIATHLGFLLFKAGCGIAFKDWHFAEGGVEGPRKLLGFKALNEEHRRIRSVEMSKELTEFLKSEAESICLKQWEAAQERAIQLLFLLSTVKNRVGEA
jgi:hypothetical protein